MKKIYCIEKWCVEDQDIHDKFNNNCEFLNCVEEPWKIGCWNFVEEYDDEEKFKNDILFQYVLAYVGKGYSGKFARKTGLPYYGCRINKNQQFS